MQKNVHKEGMVIGGWRLCYMRINRLVEISGAGLAIGREPETCINKLLLTRKCSPEPREREGDRCDAGADRCRGTAAKLTGLS